HPRIPAIHESPTKQQEAGARLAPRQIRVPARSVYVYVSTGTENLTTEMNALRPPARCFKIGE
ncbi:hypothetical protein, partial [Listeria booriae]|uniref:hypothetical protein n=1 Tax=Listeria booriae TaxID=1552123 RepID=UPI001C8C6477